MSLVKLKSNIKIGKIPVEDDEIDKILKCMKYDMGPVDKWFFSKLLKEKKEKKARLAEKEKAKLRELEKQQRAEVARDAYQKWTIKKNCELEENRREMRNGKIVIDVEARKNRNAKAYENWLSKKSMLEGSSECYYRGLGQWYCRELGAVRAAFRSLWKEHCTVGMFQIDLNYQPRFRTFRP